MKKFRSEILNCLMRVFWLVQFGGGIILFIRMARGAFYFKSQVGIVSEHLIFLLGAVQALFFVGLPLLLILKKDQAYSLYRAQLIISCFAFRFSTFSIYERLTGVPRLMAEIIAICVDVLRHVRIKQRHGDVLIRHKSLQKFSSLIALFLGLGIDLAVLGSSLHRFFVP